MEERSLEMIEVSREGGRRWCRQESGLQILWKKERENLSRLSLSEFKLATAVELVGECGRPLIMLTSLAPSPMASVTHLRCRLTRSTTSDF